MFPNGAIFGNFQAYTMELEAEVAKLKEENQELRKKQVQFTHSLLPLAYEVFCATILNSLEYFYCRQK